MRIGCINSANYNNNRYFNTYNRNFPAFSGLKFFDRFEKSDKSKNNKNSKLIDNPIEQSKYFKDFGIIDYKTKLANGFMDVASSGMISDDGSCTSSREIIVVDKNNDKVLKGLIEHSKKATVNMPDEQKANYISNLIAFYTDRKRKNITTKPNEKILAGELLGSISASGRQNSIIFKVISDETGLKTDLVKGTKFGVKSIWNVVHLPNRKDKIYDTYSQVVENANKSKIYVPMYK